MSYLVFCVFELRQASREDYLYAYKDLAMLGLRKVVKSGGGRDFTLPSTAVLGMLEGRSVDEVRSAVGRRVQEIFKSRGLSGEFFVVASADWACAGEAL
jgi:hypothetical protein